MENQNVSFFEWLQNLPLSVTISENWFPWVESAHVVALALVAGTIFIVDTRLLGLTSRGLRFSYLSERLLPWTWGAFVFAAMTGIMMFMAGATRYVDNTPMLIKLGLLALAGLNMAWFQFGAYKNVSQWDTGRPPGPARFAGAASLVLWTAIITCGRWIGFV